jgi:predicted MFS family arabinose efflux permease
MGSGSIATSWGCWTAIGRGESDPWADAALFRPDALALAVFAAGRAAAALSSSFGLLLGTRFVTAWRSGRSGRGSGGRHRSGGPASAGKGDGEMVGGLTLANVVGVPLGTAFGEALGGRGPFWILAGLAVAAMPCPRAAACAVPAGTVRWRRRS